MYKKDKLSKKKGDDDKSDSNKTKSNIELFCLNLDNEIDTLFERIEKLEKIANKFQEEYKTNLKKYDKKGAIESLKKKKDMKVI